jgi:hypothetical protein
LSFGKEIKWGRGVEGKCKKREENVKRKKGERKRENGK